MRILNLTILLTIIACVPSAKEATTTSGNINANAPYLWSDKAFPKKISISTAFTEAEVTNITDMSTAWKTAVEDKRTFFAYEAETPEITNSVNSMDSLLDNVMGIYKTTHWPPSLPGSALAVTQIFGRRYNIGSEKEFVNIEHADILVNYHIHRFDTSDSGPNYDLRTVILHEMGHFLGLQHKSTYSDPSESIMYPSIGSTTAKRAPRSIDAADMASKYGITLDAAVTPTAAAMVKRPVEYKVDPRETGEMVKILIELHADGECVHKMNGTIYQRHHHTLAK